MIKRILTSGPHGRLAMLAFLVLVSVAALTQLPRLKIDRSDERLVGATDPGWPALHNSRKTLVTSKQCWCICAPKISGPRNV